MATLDIVQISEDIDVLIDANRSWMTEEQRIATHQELMLNMQLVDPSRHTHRGVAAEFMSSIRSIVVNGIINIENALEDIYKTNWLFSMDPDMRDKMIREMLVNAKKFMRRGEFPTYGNLLDSFQKRAVVQNRKWGYIIEQKDYDRGRSDYYVELLTNVQLRNKKRSAKILFEDDGDETKEEILENDKTRARKGEEGRNTNVAYFFEDDEDHSTPRHLLGAQSHPPMRPSVIIREPLVGSDRSMANPPFTSSKPPVLKPPSKPKPQPKPAAKAVPHELPERAWPFMNWGQKDLVGVINPSELPRRVIPQVPQLEDAPAPADDVEPEPVTNEQYAEVDEPSAEPGISSQLPNLVSAPPRPDSPQPIDEPEMEIAPVNITSGKRGRNFSDDEPQLVQESEVKIRKHRHGPTHVVNLKDFIQTDDYVPYWEVEEGDEDDKIEVVKLSDISHTPKEELKEEPKEEPKKEPKEEPKKETKEETREELNTDDDTNPLEEE
jgi:hypothetical protein